MSHTNSTTNYSLPQFIPTDKPAWLVDINGAMSSIDTAIKNAKDTADTADTNASAALLDAGTAITKADAADNKASGVSASIAASFDATATYSIGDIVMYNSLLYRCIAPVTTPGAWTGANNWSRINVTDLNVSDLHDTDINSAANGQILVYTNGKWNNQYLLQYIPTQSINIDNIWCTGYQGANNVRAFFVPLPKPISSLVTSVTLQDVYVSVYSASGPSETWNNQLLSSSLGSITTVITESGILISMILSAPLSTPTYTPLTVRIVSGKLRFN